MRMSSRYYLYNYLARLSALRLYCYVYILQLSDSSHYTGLTSRPCGRLTDHETGRSISTRYKRPLKMVFLFQCPDRSSARKLEVRIKRTGAHKFLMRNQNSLLQDKEHLKYYDYNNILISPHTVIM